MKRLPLALSALAGISVASMALSGAAAASATAGSTAVPVDRQAYVTSLSTTNPVDGTLIDPYNADPSSIHVAVDGGKELARSFVHVALDYIPAQAAPTQVTMTLHLTQQSDASNTGTYPIYNVNPSAAIIEACALTSELPSKFDYTKPPAYDCQHGSAVGKANAAADTFTFQLAGLISYWKQHGNTGAALIPIAADPSQSWSVAFYKSRAAALVAYSIAAKPKGSGHGKPTPAPTAAPPTTTGSSGSGTSTGSGTPSGAGNSPSTVTLPPASTGNGSTAGAGPAAQPPAVAASTPPAPAAASSRRTGGTGLWPWVLAGSIVLAAAAIGAAHRTALLAFARRVVPPGLAAFRAHPRAYSVASAALAWGLVFTSYSVLTAPAGSAGQQLAGDTPGATVPTTPAGGSSAGSGPTSGTGAPATAGAPGGSHPGSSGSLTGTTGGATGGGSAGTPASNPAAHEFTGPGHYRTINGVPVFFPSNGGPPVAKLYTGADDTIGLTPSSLRICAHAALTYGAAFNISASDLDVFWSNVNDQGGIFGRKVQTNYQNDNYDPGTAVQAAQTCKDWNTFLLLGGIGFDQIPAVRQWAEQNHELYLHHIATIEGSAGLRYSFSSLPTVEQVGTWFGQLAVKQFAGKKVGILYRQSSNWTPGVDTFKKVLQAAGMQVVGSYGVTINQGNYTQELAQLHTAGAQVVFAWENALSEIEMIKQAQGQNWHPAWLVNGFNIITNTLGSTALDQQLWSPAEWEAYDPGYYGGGFASYASEIHEFERQYKKYDSGADLSGDGGDLLFLNWESQKGLYDLLTACGPQCTRNKVAGLLLAGWNKPSPPNCPTNFGRTSDHHHGGYLFSVLHAIKDPNGRANFVPLQRCIGNL
ncbi:MAG: branched-chain amino acid transport system substrate-binding protein [Frankiaceae bacterium]|nr:branched-chain amino acid transport system substrate-binding protein [Frankiaceae bacterium]